MSGTRGNQPRLNNRALATAGSFMNMVLSINGYLHSKKKNSLTSQPAHMYPKRINSHYLCIVGSVFCVLVVVVFCWYICSSACAKK